MDLRRRSAAIVLAHMMFAIGCASTPASSTAVAWEDAAGDVTAFANLPDLPLPDVTRVTADSANGELILRLTTSGALAPVFAYTAPDGKKRGATLGSLYLDTDNNASTGGAPFRRNSDALDARKGYERQLSIQLGFLYADRTGGSGMSSGDVVLRTEEVQITGATANYYVYELSDDPEGRHTIDPEAIGLTNRFRDLTRLGPDLVEVRVPYRALGVKPGDRVRLCFHDAQQSSSPDAESVSDDRVLQLQ